MSAARPWRETAEGLSLAVRLTPGGGADRIDGLGADAEGRTLLLVRVSARPVEGAANLALIRMIAKAVGAPKRAVRLEAGAGARVKRLLIEGSPEALAAALEAALPRPS